MTPPQPEGHRERLLAVGRKLFSLQGFAATSTREIAAQAGCNLALINHYFGSKEGLLVAVLESEMNSGSPDFLAVLREPGSPAEQLERFIDLAIDHFAEDGEFLRIAHREIIQHGSALLPKLIPPIERMIGELAGRFREARRGSAASRLDPRLTALLLVGTMQFYFIAYPLTSKLVGVESDELKSELKRQVKSVFVETLAAGRKRRSPRARNGRKDGAGDPRPRG